MKATGGGFTVGRLGTGKATIDDYFVVNPGDVKVLIPPTKLKAAGGGFTVGRLGTGKATGDIDYLKVTPDSTNIVVSDSLSGFSVSKSSDKSTDKLINLKKHNVYLGLNAGGIDQEKNQGDYNVCIGYLAGLNNQSSNKLYIANNAIKPPLIYGDFDAELLTVSADMTTRSINQTSDISLKTNLVKLTSGLNIIKSLSAYYFDWNENARLNLGFPDKKQIGLIAQDVEKVLPEIVTMSTYGYKALDYSKLTPVLINAVNEQQQTIEGLQKKIEKLEFKNQVLENKVNEIQNLKSEIIELKTLINNQSYLNGNKN